MEIRLTVRIPLELHRKAKSVAALRKETLADVVIRALHEYVDEVLDHRPCVVCGGIVTYPWGFAPGRYDSNGQPIHDRCMKE